MAPHRARTTSDDNAENPSKNVRVLRGEEELAQALARAAEGARRLQERLHARAMRDEWTAEHTDEAVGWLRFVRRSSEQHAPLVVAAPAERHQRRERPPAA